jgi:8-oxo-dGTP diphosphatase
MPLARFVTFHEVPENEVPARLRPVFAVILARARQGVVLVFNRYREVWELPGGFIDSGESPRQAAERELAEEAGCTARSTTWLGITEVNDGRAHFGAVFACETDQVPAHFENEEIAGIAFWLRGLAPAPHFQERMGHTDAALLERFA